MNRYINSDRISFWDIQQSEKLVQQLFLRIYTGSTQKTFFKQSKEMKIFQKIQKQYAVLGVSSSNPWARKHSFNKRVLMGILMFGCIIASHFEYIFRVANGFLEYMACIASLSGNIITFVSFAAIVVRWNLLFENIDNMEKLIRTSKIGTIKDLNEISI